MNIRLNLATRPYVELRSVLSRLRLIAVVLVVLAIPLLLLLHVEERKAGLAEARVSEVAGNIAALQQQEASTRERLTAGTDARILSQAAFLNTLFQRKSFSWTATMSDLEDNLPAGVQVMVIDPEVAKNGQVTIRMRITGPRDRTIDVVRNLEHSRHFVGPRLVTEALASQSPSGNGPLRPVEDVANGLSNVNFDILANYRPLPPVPQTKGNAQIRTSPTRSSHIRRELRPSTRNAAKPGAYVQPQLRGGK